jgi:hypothetical protein
MLAVLKIVDYQNPQGNGSSRFMRSKKLKMEISFSLAELTEKLKKQSLNPEKLMRAR